MRYRDVGVDLEKQRGVHKAAGELLGGSAGSYVRWINLGSVEAALHTDGVGTKTLWLLEAGKLEIAGWDCVMVNVNDVVCDGFRAKALTDYISLAPGLEEDAGEVLRGIADAAGRLGIEVLGGETAIMPDVVNGLDVSCTVLAVREARPGRVSPGDYIIGLESTGPHANGYSLLRKIFKLDERVCGGRVADIFLRPVADYTPVLQMMREGLVKTAAHITGGGFSKLRRALGVYGADIELGERPCWAEEIVRRGVPPDELYRVFNVGIGMALITDAPDDALRRAEDFGISARIIGRVKPLAAISVDGVLVE
ncbi:MAG: phosphoribosylformylglycinamidine cyclo-ligase [Thermoproteus sp.]